MDSHEIKESRLNRIMPYSDKDKAREAARKNMAILRAKRQGITTLPVEIMDQIDKICQRRRKLGLEDDRVERIERAKSYRC